MRRILPVPSNTDEAKDKENLACLKEIGPNETAQNNRYQHQQQHHHQPSTNQVLSRKRKSNIIRDILDAKCQRRSAVDERSLSPISTASSENSSLASASSFNSTSTALAGPHEQQATRWYPNQMRFVPAIAPVVACAAAAAAVAVPISSVNTTYPEAITPATAFDAIRTLIDQFKTDRRRPLTLPIKAPVAMTTESATSSRKPSIEVIDIDDEASEPVPQAVAVAASPSQEPVVRLNLKTPVKRDDAAATSTISSANQESSARKEMQPGTKNLTDKEIVSFGTFSFKDIRLPGASKTTATDNQKANDRLPSAETSPATRASKQQTTEKSSPVPTTQVVVPKQPTPGAASSKSPAMNTQVPVISYYKIPRISQRLAQDPPKCLSDDSGSPQAPVNGMAELPSEPKEKTTPKKGDSSSQLIAASPRSGKVPSVTGEADTTHRQVDKEKKAVQDCLTREALKLAYLNSLGFIDDSCFEFMSKSIIALISVPGADLAAKKAKLNEMLVGQIDKQIVLNITSSGLYSLILQADADFTLIYVFIRFADNRHHRQPSDNTVQSHQQTRLIRLLSMRSMPFSARMAHGGQPSAESTDDRIKWSKLLIDQIIANVIEPHSLNRNNLMTISLDTRLMDHMHLSIFQSNVQVRLHPSVLILPSYLVANTVNQRLGQWSFGGHYSLTSYFRTMRSLFNYLSVTKSPLLDQEKSLVIFEFGAHAAADDQQLTSETISGYFDSDNLDRLRESLESVYEKYSDIVAFLQRQCKAAARDQVALSLHAKFDSIEHYFMTCLLCDYARFVLNYQLHTVKYSCDRARSHLPWNFMGSYLHNLLHVQLVDTAEPAAAHSDSSGQSVIACEKERALKLAQVKKDFERSIISQFDTCLDPKYQMLTNTTTTTTADKDTAISIYSTLVKMFDVTYRQIEKAACMPSGHEGSSSSSSSTTDYNLTLRHSITSQELKSLLSFYKFNDMVSSHQIELEYSKFWQLFFRKMPADLRLQVVEEATAWRVQQQLALESRSVCAEVMFLQPLGKVRSYFAQFVWENGNAKVCTIVCFFAAIFLSMPSLVDFKELKHAPELASSSTSAVNYPSLSDLSGLERSLKIYNSFDSASHAQTTLPKFEDFAMINFDDIDFNSVQF